MTTRLKILHVAPACPWPPSDGGRVYMYWRIKVLAEHHDYHLVCPLPESTGVPVRETREALASCRSLRFWRPPARPRFRGMDLLGECLRRSVSRLPQSAARCGIPQARKAVTAAIRDVNPDVIMVDQSHMVAVLPPLQDSPRQPRPPRLLIAEHDVGSKLLTDFSHFPDVSLLRRWLARGEAHRLLRFAWNAYRRAHAVNFATPADAAFYRSRGWNGVTGNCPPVLPVSETVKADWCSSRRIGFLGTLGFFPNIEGIQWFCEQVWPRVLRRFPDTLLLLPVSPRDVLPPFLRQVPSVKWETIPPSPEMDRLLLGCDALISPIRMGSGIKIKNLLAMRLGMPMVATKTSMTGICAQAGRDFLQADSAESFAAATEQLLADEDLRRRIGESARAMFGEHYTPSTAGNCWLAFLASGMAAKNTVPER